MRTIWHSLAWKEWHEHKWKLVSIVAVLWGTAALAMFEGRRDAFALALGMMGLCIVPLAVFIGLGAAANERSRRTLAFLQALPAPMWPVALVKLAFGVLVLTASVLLTLPLIYALGHGLAAVGDEYRSALLHITQETLTGNWYLDLVSFGVPLSASLFLWAAAAGVNRKDEVSAGAVALAVIVGWYLVILFGRSVLFPINGGLASVFLLLAFSTAPAGFIPASQMLHSISADGSNSLWIRWLTVLITIVTLTHLALALWYVRRFGRISNREVRSPQLAVRNSLRPGWLGPPRHSPRSAIAWKQFRESAPLVLAGLVGCIGIVVALIAGETIDVSRFAELTIGVILSLGFGIALIVGIGVCLYDVGPSLNAFWRSRPINPDIWFWCKFVTGLLILLGALYLPLVAVIYVTHSEPVQMIYSPRALIMPLAAHMAIFAAAVATTCLVRHAIYGAILSLPLLYFGVAIVWTASQMAGLVGLIERPPKFWEMTQYQVALGFATTFIVSMVTAWLATRYDWGRKSRY